MARLKIVWTETATIVLRRILTFYRVRNGNSKYSRSIYTMINDVLKLVAKYPYIYKGKHSLYGYNTHKGIVAHIELYF